MPTTESHSSIVSRIRLEQADRWQNADRVSVEQLLDLHSAIAENREAILELICAELLLREELGESPTREEYMSRFPRMADVVGRQVTAHLLLGAITDSDQRQVRETLVVDFSQASTELIAIPKAVYPNVAGYEILSELGKGGMGIVYLAVHHDLKRTVALKMIRERSVTDESYQKRFRAEAEAVARLHHPNIVQIYDFGEHDGLPYFSLEYLTAGSLDRHISRHRPSIPETLSLIAKLARAIGYAHRQGIIHRDLKPANILLAPQHEQIDPQSEAPAENLEIALSDLIPKITDFGLAKSLGDDHQLTRSEAFIGTPAYMAPEQAWGRLREIGPATDVHGLGLILYEMLTGRAPFRDPSFARVLDKIRFEEVPAASRICVDIPPEVDTICRRCLQKEPGQRYRTAELLAEDLERFLNGTSQIQPVYFGYARTAFIAASFVVALLVGGSGWYFFALNTLPPASKATSGDSTTEPEFVSTAGPRTQGTRMAFLSGVRSYRLSEQSIDLDFTEADVNDMSRLLLKQGFERKNIQLLTQWSEADNPSLSPTSTNIREQLRRMLNDCIPDDTVIVVVTGMGGEMGVNGTYCYLAADSQLDETKTLISLNEFYDMFRDCQARIKLLLVDTCQTASGDETVESTFTEPPPGVAVLFACSPYEASYEHPSLRHGVFSYHVLRAFEGDADTNGDRIIELDELFQFVRTGVRDFLNQKIPGAMQTPRLETSLPGQTPILTLQPAAS